MTLVVVGCSSESFDGVDLAPATGETLVEDLDNTIESVTSAPAAELPASTNPPSSETNPQPTEPPVNPADLGRVAEMGVWYISTDGDDTASGTLPSEAFATFAKALSVVEPGHTVLVLEGEYAENQRIDTSVYVDAKGRDDAWIQLAAFPEHDVVLHGDQRNALKLEAAEYVTISGFELRGQGRDQLGSGVHIENPSHHIRIVGNTIHGFPSAGVAATGGSHLVIANNTVYDNARFNTDQHSGISLWRPQNLGFEDDPTGYSNYIVANTVYNNRNERQGRRGLTDGNCVIIDQNKISDFQGRTLIANNVCFDNGGRGVNAHSSQHIDVVNNTLFHNLGTSELSGGVAELVAFEATDVRFVNNLVTPSSGKAAAESTRGVDVIFANNAYVDHGGGDNTRLDNEPETIFAAPSTDPTIADFALAADSPAIGIGRNDFSEIVTTDANGSPRLVGNYVDAGAFESEVDDVPLRVPPEDG